MSGKMLVRPAVFDDIPWMLEQLQAFDRETQAFLVPLRNTADMVLQEFVRRFPVFVTETDGVLSGFLAAGQSPHIFNPEVNVLTSMLWWVPPQHRDTRSASLLFNAFSEYGERHADWTVMTLGRHTPIKDTSLTRRGFALQECSYLRRKS